MGGCIRTQHCEVNAGDIYSFLAAQLTLASPTLSDLEFLAAAGADTCYDFAKGKYALS